MAAGFGSKSSPDRWGIFTAEVFSLGARIVRMGQASPSSASKNLSRKLHLATLVCATSAHRGADPNFLETRPAWCDTIRPATPKSSSHLLRQAQQAPPILHHLGLTTALVALCRPTHDLWNRICALAARSALTSLLHLLRRRNGWGCYHFAGLGIGDHHNLSMNLLFEQIRLRPPVQLCKPFSHFKPAFFTSSAMFTVWTVDSQKG
jgi:hypothetical protein